jgi:hypothetical protein
LKSLRQIDDDAVQAFLLEIAQLAFGFVPLSKIPQPHSERAFRSRFGDGNGVAALLHAFGPASSFFFIVERELNDKSFQRSGHWADQRFNFGQPFDRLVGE